VCGVLNIQYSGTTTTYALPRLLGIHEQEFSEALQDFVILSQVECVRNPALLLIYVERKTDYYV
jgi:hypothetical protein